MQYQIITAPADEPVTLADAKDWLKIDGTDEDRLVTALISSARLAVEAATGLFLLPQTWRLSFDDWPPSGRLVLPYAPLQSVQVFRVINANGNASAVPLNNLNIDPAGRQPRIALKSAPPAKNQDLHAYEIDVIFGYGDANAVPETLKLAIKMLVAFWHENRGDEGASVAQKWPDAISALLTPFTLRRL